MLLETCVRGAESWVQAAIGGRATRSYPRAPSGGLAILLQRLGLLLRVGLLETVVVAARLMSCPCFITRAVWVGTLAYRMGHVREFIRVNAAGAAITQLIAHDVDSPSGA